MTLRVLLPLLLSLALQSAAAQTARLLLPETGEVLTLHFHPSRNLDGVATSFDVTSKAGVFHFTPRHPVVRIPETKEESVSSGVGQTLTGTRLDPSRRFFHAEYTSTTGRHTLLFFVSEGAASDAAPFFALGFRQDGSPFQVLQREAFDPTAVLLSPDGVEVVGETTMSQVVSASQDASGKGPYATTYDPFSVFVIAPEGPAVYSLTLSRAYNLKHYLWAGSHSREDFAVLYNVKGHMRPFGVPFAKVQTILAKGARRSQ